MNKQILALAVASALSVPAAASAAQVVGDALEIYGKVHVSLDAVDNDTDSNLSIASNSSRLGFKGTMDLNEALDAFYKIESKVVFDESGSNLASRNTYVGVSGGWGSILTGYRDTPLKDVRGKFDLFGDTVGDARSVLGNSGTFDTRAKNVLMYSLPKTGGFDLDAMYSTAYDGDDIAGQDDNDFDLTSVRAGYKINGFYITGAIESQSQGAADDLEAMRAVATYALKNTRFGFIWENLDFGADEQSGYGLNAAYKMGANTFKAQYLITDESDNGTDNGASMLSVGVDHKLAKTTSLYAMYSVVDNDANAGFQIAGGHDSDKYAVATPGDSVSALSLGMVHKF